jgi:hypothetical protein
VPEGVQASILSRYRWLALPTDGRHPIVVQHRHRDASLDLGGDQSAGNDIAPTPDVTFKVAEGKIKLADQACRSSLQIKLAPGRLQLPLAQGIQHRGSDWHRPFPGLPLMAADRGQRPARRRTWSSFVATSISCQRSPRRSEERKPRKMAVRSNRPPSPRASGSFLDPNRPFGRVLSCKFSVANFCFHEAAGHESMRGKPYRWKSSLVMKGEVGTHQLDWPVAGSATSALTSPVFVAA